MSRARHSAIPRGILALAVAFAVSGGPSALDHLVAGHAKHRCQCPAGSHDCRCPVCRGAGHGARRAALAELPACHRAKALEALAREEADAQRQAPAGVPCVRSACDTPEERLPTQAAQELFVVPARVVLLRPGWARALPAAAAAPPWRAPQPELPPPKRA